jgi:hypothetical protein
VDTIQNTTIRELQSLVERIAEQAPHLASRARRAGGIILNGKLHQLDETRFECVAADDSKAYVVDLAGECRCLDFQKRGVLDPKGNRTCKHMIAAILFRKLGTRRESARAVRVARFRRRTAAVRAMRRAA